MIKKSFLTIVFAVALVLVFVSCGNDKKEPGKTDTGDTETVADADSADTGDSEIVPDEDKTDTSDSETVPDEDNDADTDTDMLPPDGCTTTESYGVNSLTKKEVAGICYEKITERSCYKSMNSVSELIENILDDWQYKKIVFNKEYCTDLYSSEIVECPDFIPEFWKLSELVGCEIYTVDPYSACYAPCYNLYFTTNDEYFPKVSVEESIFNINSKSIDGAVGFYSTIDYNSKISAFFAWFEKGTEGVELKKGVNIAMEIVDTRPDKCKDSEGRQYYEGDLIPEKCGILVCSENGWKISYDNSPECRMCRLDEAKTKYWRCYDDSMIEWCNCVEDDETSDKWGEEWGKWSCIDRIDLQCPPRIEKCEDSEGRIYQHNDKIALECDYVYCTYNGWQTSGEPPLCELTCPNIIGEKRKWLCADGVTEVDWCECVEDEEFGGIWTYIERADLNCPTE